MASTLGTISPPNGWTTDTYYLAIDFLWESENGNGHRLAQKYGLNSPQPIMCTTPETGEGLYMFESNNRFYIWNQMDGDIWEITKSQDFDKILETMCQKGLGPLKLKNIS